MLCHLRPSEPLGATRCSAGCGIGAARPASFRPPQPATGRTWASPTPPRPHDIVFVRIYGAAPSGIEAVRTFLYRAAVR